MIAPDEPSGGSAAAGPPPGQYGQPAGSYQSFDQPQYQQPQQPQYEQPQYQQPQDQQPAHQQQGPPPGPYGYPGGPYEPQPPRETGALVVCIVLLVLALVGSFLASAAVYGNLTDDSSSSSGGFVPGGADEGGSGGTGPQGGTGAEGGTRTSASAPDDDRKAIERDFPIYPGSRRVASAKPYLKVGGEFNRTATDYVTHAGVGAVYHWYRAHLAADHLHFNAPNVERDNLHNKKITSVLSGIQNPDTLVYGELYLQVGIHGITVIAVTFGD